MAIIRLKTSLEFSRANRLLIIVKFQDNSHNQYVMENSTNVQYLNILEARIVLKSSPMDLFGALVSLEISALVSN